MTRRTSATASEIVGREERETISNRVIGKGLSQKVTSEHRLGQRAQPGALLVSSGNRGTARGPCGQRQVSRPVGDKVRGSSTARPEALPAQPWPCDTFGF